MMALRSRCILLFCVLRLRGKQGTYTWADGSKHVGFWKDGVQHGQVRRSGDEPVKGCGERFFFSTFLTIFENATVSDGFDFQP